MNQVRQKNLTAVNAKNCHTPTTGKVEEANKVTTTTSEAKATGRRNDDATAITHLAVGSRRADARGTGVVAVAVPCVLAGVDAGALRDVLRTPRQKKKSETHAKRATTGKDEKVSAKHPDELTCTLER